ncbi:hypothetical protein M422DRAFT_215436 [Sphaerobolus stellatus SS14]|uniref:1-phosphatidylinositol-3-phosphate 5-kinase n=1 Tax=Sphaerobolus stellatus (strain SS14) TaxID=990650 RepID=A0A0C9UGN8_SPHS4|nr:hypothetical protein M422DRAFT_215436 [Sphaerobolus stellatus SS14]
MDSIQSSTSSLDRQRSAVKALDDVTSLTTFNPFSEEDEHDQSSYALVTSLFSKVKNTFTVPLTSAVTNAVGRDRNNTDGALLSPNALSQPRESPLSPVLAPTRPLDRPGSLSINPSNPAPPLVFLTPVVSEAPYLYVHENVPPSRAGFYAASEGNDGGYGTAIPGFPITDDARSIRTSGSAQLRRTGSVSKVIRRIRGEGLSRDYWMDDANAKECYDCKSAFTTWRRKHHCRICGQIFCSRCASNVIKGSRFGHDGMVRVCNLCLEKLEKGGGEDDDDDRRSIISSSYTSYPQSPFATSQLFYRTEEGHTNLFSILESRRQLSEDGSISSRSRPLTPGPEWGDIPAPFRRNVADEDHSHVHNHGVLAVETPPATDIPPNEPQNYIQFPTVINAEGNLGGMSSIQFPVSATMDGIPFPMSTDTPRPLSLRTSRVNSFGETEMSAPFLRSRVQSRLDWPGAAGEAGWRTRRESTAYAQELNAISMFHLRVLLRQMLATEGIPNIRDWEETLLKLALQVAKDLTVSSSTSSMDVRHHVKIKKIPGGAPRDSEYVDGAVITKNVAHKHMARSIRHPRVMLVTFPFEFHRVEGQYMHLEPLVAQEKQYLTNLVGRVAALRPHIVLVEKSVSRIALEALLEHNIAVARTVKPSAIQLVARMTQADVFSSMDKLAVEPRLGYCARYRLQTFDHVLIPGRRKTYMRFEGCPPGSMGIGLPGCTILLRGGDVEMLQRIKTVMRNLTFLVRHLKIETHLWKDLVITLPPVTADAVPVPPTSAPMVEQGEASRPRTFSTSLMSFLAGNGPIAPVMFSPPQQKWSDPAITDVDYISTPGSSQSSIHSSSLDSQYSASWVAGTAVDEDDLPHEDATALRLTRRISESVEPYLRTFISVSATLRFPPPYPIRRMKELDDLLIELKTAWEDHVVQQEERRPSLQSIASSQSRHDRDATIKASEVDTGLSGMTGLHAHELTITDLPKTPTPGDAASFRAEEGSGSGYFNSRVASFTLDPATGPMDPDLESMRDSIASIVVPAIDATDTEDEMSSVSEKPIVLKQVSDIAKASALSLAQFHHEEHRPIWEWYIRKNADDFVLEQYQALTVREFVAPTSEKYHCKPCALAQLTNYRFYGENDFTLGHFIDRVLAEGLVPQAKDNGRDGRACPAGASWCDLPATEHSKVYVHNESQLMVTAEPWSNKIQTKTSEPPLSDMVTTWSVCRECGQATPFIPVSEETLRYSYAKFMELHFYPADVLIVPGAGCAHNIYLHHARYFAFKGMVIRFQSDRITLHEIVFPPRRIRVRPETLLELKNQSYQRMLDRSTAWFVALIQDLKLLLVELGDSDPEASIKASSFIREVERNRLQMTQDIHRIYEESPPTDTLALGRARQLLQERMVEWQTKLDTLPRPRLSQMTEKDSRNKSTAFGSVRNMWTLRRNESSSTLDRLAASSLSEVEEDYPRRTGTPSFAQSSASETESVAGERPQLASSTSQSESEAAPVLSSAALQSQGLATDIEERVSSPALSGPTALKEPKSDVESDSTIGARRVLSPIIASPLPSKLPLRQGTRVSVAELVKRYQESKVDGIDTAAGPLSNHSDDASVAPRIRRTRGRKAPSKQPMLSDFEQSYAANIAPKYLTHAARRQGPSTSRIPGPIPAAFTDPKLPSGLTSPEKRHRMAGPASRGPPNGSGDRSNKGKGVPRIASREKQTTVRQPTSNVGRATYRRTASSTGNKVQNMTKHFERISKDSERSGRRYAVIRGRRARPVASARPSVRVFDNIRDIMRNESSDDESSDADDEEEDEEEHARISPLDSVLKKKHETEPPSPVPTVAVESTSTGRTTPSIPEDRVVSPTQMIPVTRPTSPAPSSSISQSGSLPSVPPSPSVPSLRPSPPSLTPPEGWGHTIQERRSFMKAISGLWNQQFQPSFPKNLSDSLEDLAADHVHIHRDSPIALRTDEPTSIIAVALSCKDYRERQKMARMARRKTKFVNESAEVFMPDDKSMAESTSSWGLVDLDHVDEDMDAVDFLKQSSTADAWSFEFPFDDVIINCVAMFPEQFHALRRACDCDKSIIESLARCVKWNATGGKSGSGFLKTRDDRFIAKEMSKTELTAMATFAPAYFDYMASTVSAGRPTLLAKIFGCFRVSFTRPKDAKTGGKGKSSSSVFLVMENLFYDRRFTKIYDLKGSTRNRHVHATGRENEVLLDENLVKMAHLNPLYVREHSKRILRAALWNDSKFLADLNVMDYSLVVGVDSTKNELVVGIVDYIRTYTWDKKLESWVKDASFLGGGAGKGEPTIVTPKQYKARFRSAMERYFPLVPDRWMKRHDKPDEEGDNLLDWPDS